MPCFACLSVYQCCTHVNSWGWTELYIGCYDDYRVRNLDGEYTTSNLNTPYFCIEHCRKRGYVYAGPQASSYCFCGNSYEKYGSAPEAECYTQCPGDRSLMCGGVWRLSVYATGIIV
ncbi:hypothetical protein ScPMuIL_017113 [Solemya velum]